jgi:hypothetical protein
MANKPGGKTLRNLFLIVFLAAVGVGGHWWLVHRAPTVAGGEAEILWNEQGGVYLLATEVAKAPSGEFRVKKSGEYLDMAWWKRMTVPRPELASWKHHGD